MQTTDNSHKRTKVSLPVTRRTSGKNLGKYIGRGNGAVLYCWKVNNAEENQTVAFAEPYYFVFEMLYRKKQIEVRCSAEEILNLCNDFDEYIDNLHRRNMTAITSKLYLEAERQKLNDPERLEICRNAFQEVSIDCLASPDATEEETAYTASSDLFSFHARGILSASPMPPIPNGPDAMEVLEQYLKELFHWEVNIYKGDAYVPLPHIDDARHDCGGYCKVGNISCYTDTTLFFTHRPYFQGKINSDYPWSVTAKTITFHIPCEDDVEEESSESLETEYGKPITVELSEEEFGTLIEKLKSAVK